ncbi:MAG: NAD-dependent epimerase/dehydratase family protein [Halobacteriaceae archaeon]
MAIETVAVTGGNGKIGEAILAHLNEHGYETANLARGKRREEVSDSYYTTDLLEAGEVYGSLARSGADAIIHMGTIPGPTSHPGYVTYESNVMSSYHVLEAATELGLESACLASSVNAMGAIYQDDPIEVEYFPIDEDHPLTPRDPYAMGKHALEVTADGFGRQNRAPHTVSTLRYPWVATGEELRAAYAESERTLDAVDVEAGGARNDLYLYLHIEDAADVARRCVEADYEGHETFWAVAADSNMETPTAEIIDEVYPDDVDVRADFEDHEALVTCEKARDLLGWEPERTWRDL